LTFYPFFAILPLKLIHLGGEVMRKLEVLDKEIMTIAIRQEIMRSEESRYDHRLHGVLLVCQGISCREVAGFLGQNPRTVQRWVRRFNDRGFAGLSEMERPGRPSRLKEEYWDQLEDDLRKHPNEFGYRQNLWDGKLLSHHLFEQYGLKTGVRQCQRIFRQMGFRFRKPRPVIANADPEAKRRYKKITEVGQKRGN
jgi:transposase